MIGAMKCGTTTLYGDLLGSPDIFMPHVKEPCNLIRNDMYTADGLASYERLFVDAKPGQLAGEASTLYAALPDFADVPERVHRTIGPDLKLIYVVRDPVARIVSHYQHMVSMGPQIDVPKGALDSIDAAVQQIPRLVDWSRYAMQLQAWLEWFKPEQIRIVQFERYIADRAGTTEAICRFLGVRPPPKIDATRAYNRTGNRPVVRGVWAKLRGSTLYRSWFARYVPLPMRDTIRRVVLPRERVAVVQPGDDTLRSIREQLADDQRRLALLFGGCGDAVCMPDPSGLADSSQQGDDAPAISRRIGDH